jgi:hypothetical protein
MDKLIFEHKLFRTPPNKTANPRRFCAPQHTYDSADKIVGLRVNRFSNVNATPMMIVGINLALV